MVVWVFAGGGETEARGLLPFLKENFPECNFIQRFPLGIKPAGKPPRRAPYPRGASGSSLRRELRKRLIDALRYDGSCDLILVFDDLDCRDVQAQGKLIEQTIDDVDGTQAIERLIGFASPEIEAWIVADWNHVMQQHTKFRGCYVEMNRWLASHHQVDFNRPENFGAYDQERDCCDRKLSAAIQESALAHAQIYSKAVDSSALVRELSAANVMTKCPLFRRWYLVLQDFCATNSD